VSHILPFIDRVEELKALTDWCSKSRHLSLYIYGPEGCGKTRLLREFVSRFKEIYGDRAIAVYIDALERESIEKALLSTPGLSLALDTLTSVIDKTVNIGASLAEKVATILEKVVGAHRLKNNYVTVAVDDVASALGIDNVERYVKWLYELANKLDESYRPNAINFIITTSEGFSRERVSRHGYSHVILLWNLSREAFEEMFYKLTPLHNVNFEIVWNTLGGNPRKLIELATVFNWNLDNMMKKYTAIAREIVEKIISLGLVRELKMILEDIDAPRKKPSENMIKLTRILIEKNMIIYVDWPTLTGRDLTIDENVGIGKAYAWQVPIFRKTLEAALKSI
jgi:hypothetical protein